MDTPERLSVGVRKRQFEPAMVTTFKPRLKLFRRSGPVGGGGNPDGLADPW